MKWKGRGVLREREVQPNFSRKKANGLE